MQTTTDVTRHYSQPDAAMRQDIRTMHGHYLAHQAAFQGFNPDFDADFGTEWLPWTWPTPPRTTPCAPAS
ncbi:MAG: hypothetical protein JWR44_1401 [Hymenobacter sp.]|jgi:hypothetical protein|nr:hypothetical protein [Hymenobacter sp.]